MDEKLARDAFTRYFRFNNERTLSTDVPSALRVIETDDYTAYLDSTRRYDNQVVVHGSCPEATLRSVLQLYPPENAPEISIERTTENEALEPFLRQQGFQPAYLHEFLYRAAKEPMPRSTEQHPVRVERWGSDRADDFLQLLKTSGLSCADSIWQSKRPLYCTDRFRCYVAFVENTPCAWATSFIDHQVATLANAYTQEAFRGQGCQTALLRARIEDAAALGVEWLLTDVLADTVSSKNCKAFGFRRRSVKAVWEPSENAS